MEWESVACEVNHIDVARAACDAFLENLGRLVDKREDQTLDNFLVAYLTGVRPMLER